MLVFVLEENLTQSRILKTYNVVLGNVLVFEIDINLTLDRILTLQCMYVLEFALKGNLTHVRFSLMLLI